LSNAGRADGIIRKGILSIPSEVIRATIRNNLKCFVVSDPKTGKLTNKFIPTRQHRSLRRRQGHTAGNERVIARD